MKNKFTLLQRSRQGLFIALAWGLAQASAVSLASQQDDLNFQRSQPGFAAEIPSKICLQNYPFGKYLTRNLVTPSAHAQFRLFAFTTKKFDSNKQSILVVDGGPGGIWNSAGPQMLSSSLANYNLVYFHYRGAGCSIMPKAIAFDSLISSNEILGDIEAIRNSFAIQSWQAVIGASYGTNLARRYAHEFPRMMKYIVLEGLDAPSNSVQLKTAVQKPRISKTLRERFQKSEIIKNYINSAKFEEFAQAFDAYLRLVPVEKNYYFMGYWQNYKDLYVQYYHSIGQNMPSYFNAQTFGIVTSLAYLNADANADSLVLELMEQFHFAKISENLRAQVSTYIQQQTYSFYPFLNPHYIESFQKTGLLSQRVMHAMIANDALEGKDSLCSTVNTLVINGTQDSATPVGNVQKYLGDRTCVTASLKTALIVQKGGHSNIFSMRCLSQYADAFIQAKPTEALLDKCELEVQVENY